MEEVRKSLTEAEQGILADLYEQLEIMKALGKALSQRQMNVALTSMASDMEWEQYLRNKGEIQAQKWVFDFLKHNHAAWKKRNKAKEQENVE